MVRYRYVLERSDGTIPAPLTLPSCMPNPLALILWFQGYLESPKFVLYLKSISITMTVFFH